MRITAAALLALVGAASKRVGGGGNPTWPAAKRTKFHKRNKSFQTRRRRFTTKGK